MKSISRLRAILAISMLGLASALADDVKQYNLDTTHRAIEGYDPVAYITDGKAVKGSPELHTDVDGVTYYFATAEHLAKFKASPAKYKPAYGGWCATAMADGKKVEVDPKNFIVTNGRLFLFYKYIVADASSTWKKNPAELEKKADAAWLKTAGK